MHAHLHCSMSCLCNLSTCLMLCNVHDDEQKPSRHAQPRSVAVQMHGFSWFCDYIVFCIPFMFCIPFTASQNLVACSTEEYKAPGQPEQEVFQDGSGRTWDRCTVTGLFSSEVNCWSCDCSIALSPTRQLHMQRLLYTHVVNLHFAVVLVQPFSAHLSNFDTEQRTDSAIHCCSMTLLRPCKLCKMC